MSVWILDTDCVSLFQRQQPQIVQCINAKAPATLAVTAITIEEQLRGRLANIRRASEAVRLIAAYQRLADTVHYFCTIQVMNFDRFACEQYVKLVQQKIRIGRQDLKIAAIVLANNAILVTRNQRDFVQVPGLQIEDWTSG